MHSINRQIWNVGGELFAPPPTSGGGRDKDSLLAIRPCYPMGRVALHRGISQTEAAEASNERARARVISELQPFGILRRLRRWRRRRTTVAASACPPPSNAARPRSVGRRASTLQFYRFAPPSTLPGGGGVGGGGSDASSEIMTECGGGRVGYQGRPRTEEEAGVIFRGEKIKAAFACAHQLVVVHFRLFKATIHFIFVFDDIIE